MGMVFNIQRYSVQDGPGIRTTVFLKGCSLNCLWCSNPESQKAFPEVAHRDSLCTKCNRCVEVCDIQAITLSDKGIKIDRKKCNGCGKCVDVCYPGALTILGEEISVEQVFEVVSRDDLFYRNSGGGVTVSGGEPLNQADFTASFLKRCQQSGLYTALDTCGFAEAESLEKVLEYTDLVLYDLKHMDVATHVRVTGQSPWMILNNAKLVTSKGIPTIIRVPVIPGITDSESNIRAICNFVVSLNGVSEIDLLPYHRFGVNKYAMLDRPYDLEGLQPVAEEQMQRLEGIIKSFGFVCQRGG